MKFIQKLLMMTIRSTLGARLRSYIMELENYQVEQIAKTIMFDIQSYIAEHRLEYEAFKKAYEQNSTLKIK